MYRFAGLCVGFVSVISAADLLPETGGVQGKRNNFTLKTDSGSVRISAGKKMGWTYTISGDKPNCKISKNDTATRLMLQSTKADPSGPECNVNWTIELPANTRINMHAGLSDASINGMARTADIHIGSGSLTTRSPLKKLTVHSGRATIKAFELAGDSSIHNGNGTVLLKWTKKPHNHRVTLHVGMGDVSISAPSETMIDVSGLKSPPFGMRREVKLKHGMPPDLAISGNVGVGSLAILPN